MLIEIRQDVRFHLQLRRADKEHLYPVKLGQQIRQRSRRTPLIQLANNGYAKAIQRTLPVNSVQVEQGLGRMLPAIAIPRIDHRHRRDFRGAASAVLVGVPNHNHIRIPADNPDGIFHLLTFNLGRKRTRIFGRQNPAAQAMHGRLEREPSARRRRIKKRGHDAVLIVERASARHHALHALRALE